MEEKIKCYIYTITNGLSDRFNFLKFRKLQKSLIFLCGREIFICEKVILNSRNAKDQKTNNNIDDWLTSIFSKSRWYCYWFVQGPSFDFQRIWWWLFWMYTMSVPKHRLLAWQMIPSGLIFHQQRYLLSDSQE
jgi:hypothetical protein